MTARPPEASQSEAHLQTQYAVVRALVRSRSIEQAAPAILHALGETLGWRLGALWRVDEEAGVLRCVSTWNAAGGETAFEQASRSVTLAAGQGLPGRVFSERRAVWLTDVQADPNYPRADVAAQSGVRSALAFPIATGAEVLGAIELMSVEQREPDEGLLQALSAIGSQIGLFLERLAAEAAVRASDARKTAILEAALDCIVTIDHHGCVIDFNPAAERTFGYRRADVVGRELAELIVPPALRDRHRRGVERYVRGEPGRGMLIGRRVEMPAVRADGGELPVELTLTPVDVPGPAVVTGYLRDLSDRVRSDAEREAALAREREARAEAHRLAAQLQAALLPQLAVSDTRVTLGTCYRPGEHRLMLGGDFYDVTELADGTLAVLIGDVSGHGPQAAALGANLRAAWRMLVREGREHADVLRGLDTMLVHERPTNEFFATVCCAWFPPARDAVLVTSAGHPYPLVLPDGEAAATGAPGPPLGFALAPAWPLVERPLRPEAAVLFYTDGLIDGREAPDSPRRLGLDGLRRLLAGRTFDTPGLSSLADAVAAANGGGLPDDLALVAVSFAPVPAGAGRGRA